MRAPDLQRIDRACRDIAADLRAAARAEPSAADQQRLIDLADAIEERVEALAARASTDPQDAVA